MRLVVDVNILHFYILFIEMKIKSRIGIKVVGACV